MNNYQFMEEVEKSYQRSVKVLLEKEKEYSIPGDRLAQFHDAAALSDGNACNALIGMAVKHYTSIVTMARDPHLFSLEKWDEKLTDLRNYTFLLGALVRDLGVK
jgi:hypothetical protein